MPYMKPTKPFGVNPALKQDRMNVIQVINGDSWKVDADVWNPSTGAPATVETVKLEFVLSENRFDPDLIWVGTWFDGIYPDDVVDGLVHVKIPSEISSQLRRGIYAFSLKATDYLDGISETQLKGHFQVEYEPSSDTHDIPYRKMPEGNVYPEEEEDEKRD